MRYPGFDLVRLLAMVLVTLQHAFSLTGHDDWTELGGITLGQVGVALFLFISGFLAAKSTRPPWAWLKQRLWRLLPAYWIVLAVSFALVMASGERVVSIDQIASQFAGLGFWTHRWDMVNKPTWFINVLLMGYFGVFLIRLVRLERVLTHMIFWALFGVAVFEPKPWLLIHFLVFSTGYLLAFQQVRVLTPTLIALTLVFELLGWKHNLDWLSASLTMLAMIFALMICKVPNWITVIGAYSYEYFLIHGVALNIALKKLPVAPWLAVLIAVVASMAAAVVLHRLVSPTRKRGFV